MQLVAQLLWCPISFASILASASVSNLGFTHSAEIGAYGSTMVRREKVDDVDDGVCDAGLCKPSGEHEGPTSTWVLKPEGKRPKTCAITGHCTPEECCVGFCNNFPCPDDSKLKGSSTFPPACKEHECTAHECCAGTCDSAKCPPDSSALGLDERPERCLHHPCEPKECCRGTCKNFVCPAGSELKDGSIGTTCESYPCAATECCESACTESLCAAQLVGGVTFVERKVMRNAIAAKPGETPGKSLATDLCEDFPCKAKECCLGTCDGVCDSTHPDKIREDQPHACEGYECTYPVCCSGQCSAAFCEHYQLPLKADAEWKNVCKADPCTPWECCHGECVEERCPKEFGLVQKLIFPDQCDTLNCTTAECCDSICVESICPRDRGLSLIPADERPERCDAATCTRDECCK